MSLSDGLQFLHVGAAFLFVAGLVGRDLVLDRARRSTDLGDIQTLVSLADPFDRLLVIPGSMAVPLLGILTWWSEHLPVWSTGARWVTVSLVAFASLLPLVPLVFLPRGRVFEEALTAAEAQGRVTPELTAAFRDPAVAAARWYERVVVAVVILLMVTKPF